MQSAIIKAAKAGDVAALLQALGEDEDPNKLEGDWNALHEAIWHNRAQAVQLLLEKGANPNMKDSSQMTEDPLSLCLTGWGSEGKKIVEALLTAGAKAKTSHLTKAADIGQADVFERLCKAGANACVKDAEGNRPEDKAPQFLREKIKAIRVAQERELVAKAMQTTQGPEM